MDGTADYPHRSVLIGDMCGVLKAARAPNIEESRRYGLDGKTRQLLNCLVRRLSEHLYFEQRTRKDLFDRLFSAITDYRTKSSRPEAKALAAEVLDGLSRPPSNWLTYLGLNHLMLPSGFVIGRVLFLHPDAEDGLGETFTGFGELAPKLFCSISGIAGTSDLALQRARRDAESALMLVRQKILHGFGAKMYPGQIAFGLSGHWTRKEDGRFDHS